MEINLSLSGQDADEVRPRSVTIEGGDLRQQRKRMRQTATIGERLHRRDEMRAILRRAVALERAVPDLQPR